jgi:hypothetical protein
MSSTIVTDTSGPGAPGRRSRTSGPESIGPGTKALEDEGPLVVIDQLLRDRRRFLARIEDARDLTMVARTLIITIAVSSGIFGAALGAYREGAQILFAAIKLPLVVLLTAGIAAPAVSAARRAIQGGSHVQRDAILVLSSLALGSLIIAALVPIVLLAEFFHASYHAMIMLAVVCCAVGGAMGLAMFVRGIGDDARWMISAVSLAVFALVGTQMSWTFRPYLVRPRSEAVPFVRAVEGSFLDAVWTTKDSIAGIYHRDHAPLPGEVITE